MFDNILQYYKEMKGIISIEDIRRILEEKWKSLLKKDGILELDYGYDAAVCALRKMKDRNYESINDEELKNTLGLNDYDNDFVNFVVNFQKKIIDKDVSRLMGNDFICNYIKLYDDYELKFINGVEIDVKDNPKNVALIYKNSTLS